MFFRNMLLFRMLNTVSIYYTAIYTKPCPVRGFVLSAAEMRALRAVDFA